MIQLIKIWIAPKFDQSSVLPLASLLAVRGGDSSNLFYRYDYSWFNFYGFKIEPVMSSADFIMLPQGVRSCSGVSKKYIDYWIERGGQEGKKVLVFTAGDLQHGVVIPRAIVFKALNYRFLKKENEIYIPVYVDDLLAGRELALRHKGDKPVVGFCGWAEAPGLIPKAKMKIKNLGWESLAWLTRNQNYLAYKKGIWYRKRAIDLLQADPKIKSNFIIRPSYSGSAKTISLDPAQARKEFIDNIISSDLVLTPKGDGNSSARFYEVLSLGRIPILIDTEIILPLEDIIDYDSFILRIPYRQLDQLPDLVSKFYARLSDEDFVKMQQKARDVFLRYLRYDSFFSYVFQNVLNQKS
jgi:hypothetical protein